MFNLVKTRQSMWFQYLLVQCPITRTGDGCVHAVAKLISRGEEGRLSFSVEGRTLRWEFKASRTGLGRREVKVKREEAISTLCMEYLPFFSFVFL